MRLTMFTDVALRTLIYLASHPGRLVTIAETAAALGVSPNHLMKVVQHLAASGHVTTLRGNRGGLRLARPAADITLGDVIRHTEPGLSLLPVPETGRLCLIPGDAALTTTLGSALAACMAVLDARTLADLAEGIEKAVQKAP